MALEITSMTRKRISDAVRATPELEVCGLLFGSETRIDRATVCANVAADPRRTFEIDPVALFAALRAERSGEERLIGYWHSHPSGTTTPSATDAARAAPDGKVWLIAAGDEIAAWRAVAAPDATRFDNVALIEIKSPYAEGATAAGELRKAPSRGLQPGPGCAKEA
jgi:proteasome lid subunit RPN8/RPN11